MNARLLALPLALLALAAPTIAHAELWCAQRLRADEWGVQVFGDETARVTGALPSFVFTEAPSPPVADPAPVRMLMPDSGVRAVPVLQFYGGIGWELLEVSLAVGFRQGDARAWYPQVDARQPGIDANNAENLAARALLQQTWTTFDAWSVPTDPGPDPSMQLYWNHLSLASTPPHNAESTDVAWVDALRAAPGALWVTTADTSERFVFYEADSAETPLVTAVRTANGVHVTASPDYALADVFVVERHGDSLRVHYEPTLAAGASADISIGDPIRADAVEAETTGRMRALFVDASEPTPTDDAWNPEECVMGRIPAVPTTTSNGYTLYEAEVDALLATWGETMFGRDGTTVIYREDPAYLDEVAPLVMHTSMFHFFDLRRLSLAIVVVD